MTAQPHLTITLVREVPIYGPNLAFKTFIAKLVDKLSNLDKLCHCSYIKAENILLDELNIENWSPKHKLWSVKIILMLKTQIDLMRNISNLNMMR